jgi:predicted nucleotidyltransferase
MALNPSERTDQIQRFLNHLRTQIVVERAILYGSVARGQTHADSDIDLAVLSPDFASLDRFSRLRLLLRAAWQANTDWIEPIGYTPQEFDTSPAGTFADEIKNHGVVVYDIMATHLPLAVHEPGTDYATGRESE